jgi:hypothetical protein
VDRKAGGQVGRRAGGQVERRTGGEVERWRVRGRSVLVPRLRASRRGKPVWQSAGRFVRLGGAREATEARRAQCTAVWQGATRGPSDCRRRRAGRRPGSDWRQTRSIADRISLICRPLRNYVTGVMELRYAFLCRISLAPAACIARSLGSRLALSRRRRHSTQRHTPTGGVGVRKAGRPAHRRAGWQVGRWLGGALLFHQAAQVTTHSIPGTEFSKQ